MSNPRTSVQRRTTSTPFWKVSEQPIPRSGAVIVCDVQWPVLICCPPTLKCYFLLYPVTQLTLWWSSGDASPRDDFGSWFGWIYQETGQEGHRWSKHTAVSFMQGTRRCEIWVGTLNLTTVLHWSFRNKNQACFIEIHVSQ